MGELEEIGWAGVKEPAPDGLALGWVGFGLGSVFSRRSQSV